MSKAVSDIVMFPWVNVLTDILKSKIHYRSFCFINLL
jgi:hypothetical protein